MRNFESLLAKLQEIFAGQGAFVGVQIDNKVP